MVESRDWYETILETIRDGVYTLDTTGQITWVNNIAVENFDIGYTRDELVGAMYLRYCRKRISRSALLSSRDY